MLSPLVPPYLDRRVAASRTISFGVPACGDKAPTVQTGLHLQSCLGRLPRCPSSSHLSTCPAALAGNASGVSCSAPESVIFSKYSICRLARLLLLLLRLLLLSLLFSLRIFLVLSASPLGPPSPSRNFIALLRPTNLETATCMQRANPRLSAPATAHHRFFLYILP